MTGHPGCRRRRARATGLSPVGPPWACGSSPLPGSASRAHLAWFRCRAPVGPFHAVCEPPCFLPRCCALSGLLGGGARPGPFPPVAGSWSCAPLWACLGWAGAAGRPVCCPSSGTWPGGPEGQGVAVPRSVVLPPLGGHQSRSHQRYSVDGGRGLHSVPVRVRVLSPGAACGVSLCAGAGLPACRGHCGSGRVAVWGRVAYGPKGGPPREPRPAFFMGGGTCPGPAWGGG